MPAANGDWLVSSRHDERQSIGAPRTEHEEDEPLGSRVGILEMSEDRR